MGITPYDNKSSISLLHRYRVFNGYKNYQTQSHFFPTSAYRIMHGGAHSDSLISNTYSSKDFESYKIVELRFKYFIAKRFEMNLFLPLLNNKSKVNSTYFNHTGFGDVSLNTAYHIITPLASKMIRHKLIGGLGIKLPTGNYYAHDKNSDRLPFEMQSGSGSFDGFGYLNYMFMAKNLGVNLSLNYKANGTNKFKEQMGNSQNHFATIFYKIAVKKMLLYPSIQANFEHTNGLRINDQWQKDTQFNSLLVGPGLDFYFNSFSINASWQFTAIEKIADGSLKSAGRINVGLNYSFGRKERK